MKPKSGRNAFPYAAGVVILAMLLLLVRENEGRTAAESKLRSAERTVEELRSEKSSVAMELETQISLLEGKLHDLGSRFDALTAEKQAEAERYEARLEESAARLDETVRAKDAEIAEADARARADAKKFGDVLAEKKAEIADLGAQLEDASAKYAALLKKKESLESRALACEERVGQLEQSLKKAERLSAELNDAVQKGQLQTTAVD